MAIQFLLVTFPEQRTVQANGTGVGITNHTLMLPADEYEISLEGGGCSPASQDIALDGTSMVKPLVVAFTATEAVVATRGIPTRGAIAPPAIVQGAPSPAGIAAKTRTRSAPLPAPKTARKPPAKRPSAKKAAKKAAGAAKTAARGKKHA